MQHWDRRRFDNFSRPVPRFFHVSPHFKPIGKRRLLPIAVVVLAVAVIAYFASRHRPALASTGVVTTDDVIVSSEIQGRLQHLAVRPGDKVERGQLLGLIAPQEWQADMSYYENSERSAAAQVAQAAADLEFEDATAGNQIKQAEANLASSEAQAAQADADRENARLNFVRENDLRESNVNSAQAYDQARTAYDSAKAHAEAQHKQVVAMRAAVELARASTSQVAVRRAALEASRRQLAASAAQQEKARVHLGYTEIHAPIGGVVDVRAALEGEVVNPGQAIVTLIDPDDLWVRADVEESYIERVRLGDKMAVRLPSGEEREGTVFFRGVDADYATQRDVSRTKRDIKTFEIRLRCDNRDRVLAVGMTATAILPLK
jgi:HlyD family secretion protein